MKDDVAACIGSRRSSSDAVGVCDNMNGKERKKQTNKQKAGKLEVLELINTLVKSPLPFVCLFENQNTRLIFTCETAGPEIVVLVA